MTACDEPLSRTAAVSPPTQAEERVRRDLALYNNGLAVGVLGGAVTSVALPSLALITLKATPFELSVLYAAQRFPPAVTVLFGGALAGRHRRLALLTWGKAAGGVLLLVAVLGAYLGFLSLPLLCVIGFPLVPARGRQRRELHGRDQLSAPAHQGRAPRGRQLPHERVVFVHGRRGQLPGIRSDRAAGHEPRDPLSLTSPGGAARP